MTEVMIRPAEIADIPAITVIHADLVKTGAILEPTPLNELEMAAQHAGVVDEGYPYLVALDGDAVIGFAHAGPYRQRPAYRNTVESAVFVAPAMQRRGLGRALLRWLVRRLEELGFRQALAVIGCTDRLAPVRLHESEGYRRAGTLKKVGYVHEKWVDCVLMQRQLGPGAKSPPNR